MELLILAAGSSQRFGAANKMLAPWHQGATETGTVIAAVVAAGLRVNPTRLVVVTGFEAEFVQQSLREFFGQIELCHNPDWAQGMGSSLASGARFLAPSSRPAVPLMVLLGDMPLIGGETLCLLAAVAREFPDRITQPAYLGHPGHPVIWPADLRPLLEGLEGETGGKAVMARLPHRRSLIDWPDDSILRDIDWPADLDDLRARAGDSGERVGRQTPVRY